MNENFSFEIERIIHQECEALAPVACSTCCAGIPKGEDNQHINGADCEANYMEPYIRETAGRVAGLFEGDKLRERAVL